MINIRILSDYNFLICTNDYEEEINKYCYFDMGLDDFEKVFLKIYPLENQKYSIPFCICIESQNGNIISKNTENVKFYKFSTHYEIIISPLFIFQNDFCFSENIVTNKTTCNVNMWKNMIEFTTKKHSSKTFLVLDDHLLKSSNGNVIVIGKHQDYYKALIYCTKTNETFCFDGQQIEFSNNKLQILSNPRTFAEHRILTTYEFDQFGPRKKTSELYQTNHNKKKYLPQIIPYLFLEALSVNDIKLAKSFVSKNLAENNIQTFSKYFGDFKKIEIYSISPLIYSLYYNDNARSFEFSMEEHCISEISEI